MCARSAPGCYQRRTPPFKIGESISRYRTQPVWSVGTRSPGSWKGTLPGLSWVVPFSRHHGGRAGSVVPKGVPTAGRLWTVSGGGPWGGCPGSPFQGTDWEGSGDGPEENKVRDEDEDEVFTGLRQRGSD